jgi:hypothetical protein
MNKCPQCGKEELQAQLACTEESCPLDPGGQVLRGTEENLFTLIEEVEEPPIDLFSEPGKKEYTEPRQIRLTGGKIITLNEQQCEALDLMSEWWLDKSDLFFVLSGYAGTGKTTITKEFLKFCANRDRMGYGSIAVTAPTHKAKKVIADATGQPSATIQSLLGLRPDVDVADFDVNKPEFAPKKTPAIKYYRLIVLDEGSMLNKDLWKMLKEQAMRNNVKLLVMLDAAQLPPVKEEISAVLRDEQVVYKYQLTKVERQAGSNPLMGIYDAIRNNIEAKADTFHKESLTIELVEVPGVQEAGIKFINDLQTFGRLVVTAFQSDFFQWDKNYCKVLCWTNSRVLFWNQSIRKTIINTIKPTLTVEQQLHVAVLMPDELVMGYKSYTDGIENSGEYRILDMQYSSRLLEHTKSDGKGNKSTITRTVNGYRVAMEDISQGTILNAFILEPDREEEEKFVTIFNSYLWSAKVTKAWTPYFSFKSEILLLRNITDKAGTLVCGKDLDYAYALSVHKSQGSTYDQVFIDEANINLNRNHTERNKLKYVAFSRPRYLATVFTGGV